MSSEIVPSILTLLLNSDISLQWHRLQWPELPHIFARCLMVSSLWKRINLEPVNLGWHWDFSQSKDPSWNDACVFQNWEKEARADLLSLEKLPREQERNNLFSTSIRDVMQRSWDPQPPPESHCQRSVWETLGPSNLPALEWMPLRTAGEQSRKPTELSNRIGYFQPESFKAVCYVSTGKAFQLCLSRPPTCVFWEVCQLFKSAKEFVPNFFLIP